MAFSAQVEDKTKLASVKESLISVTKNKNEIGI